MLFSNEDKTLIKNLHLFKNAFTVNTGGIFGEKLEKERTGHLIEKR